ncbi:hypothetical protein L1887_16474 [Cichorium endivia]|nr:hypothetical protein L1887_16474 [Cichorium endivia]
MAASILIVITDSLIGSWDRTFGGYSRLQEQLVSDLWDLGELSVGTDASKKIVYGFLPVDPASGVNVDPFLIESHHRSIMNETPLTDNSGEFKVRSSGGPVIHSGGNTMIWSSNYTVSVTNLDPVAQLLDTGNLVVWDKNQNMIWQSFDYPGDTLLPGMKFGKDLVTGMDRYLTSWRTPNDPFPGSYVYSIFTNGYPQTFERKGSDIQFRIGARNGVKFHGLPMDQPNPLYSADFIVNQKEIYYKYKLKSSIGLRVFLMSDGNIVRLQWVERMHDWIQYGNYVIDACGVYGLCGPYGSCSINRYPPCRCMDGFEPTLEQEWNQADWSSGCKLKKPLSCVSSDGFKRFRGLKFPDTQWSWYNESMSLGECETACKIDCNCTAYADLDIRNGGSGCLLWFGDLIDIRDYDEDQYIYIRMAASELTDRASNSRRTKLVITILVVSSAALLLFVAGYVYRNRKKRLHMKGGVYLDLVDVLNVFRILNPLRWDAIFKDDSVPSSNDSSIPSLLLTKFFFALQLMQPQRL